jgi:hypothetical protein
MTIEEVLHRTQNGLHDAYLLNISVNYRECVLRIDLNWWAGDLHSEIEEVREAYREGSLIISGLQYFVSESPATAYSPGASYIDGYVTRADDVTRMSLPDLSSEASRYSIFVGDWNSCIHFAGTSAEVIPADLLVNEMVA